MLEDIQNRTVFSQQQTNLVSKPCTSPSKHTQLHVGLFKLSKEALRVYGVSVFRFGTRPRMNPLQEVPFPSPSGRREKEKSPPPPATTQQKMWFVHWLQLVAAGCSWLQLVAAGCSWLQLVAAGCSWLQLVAAGCSWLQLVAVWLGHPLLKIGLNPALFESPCGSTNLPSELRPIQLPPPCPKKNKQ